MRGSTQNDGEVSTQARRSLELKLAPSVRTQEEVEREADSLLSSAHTGSLESGELVIIAEAVTSEKDRTPISNGNPDSPRQSHAATNSLVFGGHHRMSTNDDSKEDFESESQAAEMITREEAGFTEELSAEERLAEESAHNAVMGSIQRAMTQHKRKVSQFGGLKQELMDQFELESAVATQLAHETMASIHDDYKKSVVKEISEDSITQEAVSQHRRARSRFDAVRDVISEQFGDEIAALSADPDRVTREVMKQLFRLQVSQQKAEAARAKRRRQSEADDDGIILMVAASKPKLESDLIEEKSRSDSSLEPPPPSVAKKAGPDRVSEGSSISSESYPASELVMATNSYGKSESLSKTESTVMSSSLGTLDSSMYHSPDVKAKLSGMSCDSPNGFALIPEAGLQRRKTEEQIEAGQLGMPATPATPGFVTPSPLRRIRLNDMDGSLTFGQTVSGGINFELSPDEVAGPPGLSAVTLEKKRPPNCKLCSLTIRNLEDQINHLNQALKQAIASKTELAMETAKEIDNLRRHLKRFCSLCDRKSRRGVGQHTARQSYSSIRTA